MSGQSPPEWEDPRGREDPPEWEDPQEREDTGEEFRAQGSEPDAAAEARLSEVAAYLATVPAPVLPAAVEARISAAIDAEAAARAGKPDRSRTLGPAPARARVRRRREFRSMMAIGPLLVCLVFAGLGYALSRGGASSSSSGANSTAASPSSAAGASQPVAGPANSGLSPAGAATGPDRLPAVRAGESPVFVVTASGTVYQRATLAGQVRARLAAARSPSGATTAPAGNSPSATPTASAPGRYAPTPALLGCVLHLTGGSLPRLVDQATYDGTPAYVVASSSRVWVVGLGCTATQTELITSVALAGLPGNLRALVSVEQ